MQRKESTESQESQGDALPITEFRDHIVQLVKDHLYCIVTGETGSGKSTQIAQFMVDGIGKTFDEMDQDTFEAQTNGSQAVKGNISRNTHRREQQSDRFKVVVTQPRKVAAI